MRRAYRFLLRPTTKQSQALADCVEHHRQLYNAALEERREAYRTRRVTVRYGDQSAQLKDIRRGDLDQARWSFSSQQGTLRRLDTAMTGFFGRVKTGGRPGYPRFKGAGWFDSVQWPRDGDGCRWDSVPDSGQVRVYLQGVGQVRVHRHRKVDGRVKTITVKRAGRRWYVVLACDDVPAQPLPPTGHTAGIDLGVAALLTASDGTAVPNPRHLATVAERLAAAQQTLARFPRRRPADRTGRHRRAVARVAALHGTVRRQRLDHHHKTALALVRRYDVIAHEDLNIAGMTRAPAPKPDGDGGHLPNGSGAKAGLNRSILDAGWGQFLNVLHAKAESAGRVVVAVDARNTSRTCHACGHCEAGNRVTQAEFACLACGHAAHADVNAAQNILRAGLALQAATAA